MKIYSTNQIFGTKNLNITYINNSSQRYKINNYHKQNYDDINSYPKNYYLNQLSFGLKSRLSADDLIAKIGEENFPSQEIIKKLKSFGNSNDFSLYDIHKEHYKDLLNCSTLEEAKQKYPEFKEVIDAKDIDYNSKNKESAIYKIGNKKIPNIDIKDLSLELLKKYYGQLINRQKQEFYYNFGHLTIDGLFNLLNIKKMNYNYILFATKSNDKTRQKISKSNKGRKVGAEGRKRMSIAQTGKKLSLETRKRMSIAKTGRKLSNETKTRISTTKKQKMATPEYKEKTKKYWEAQSLAHKMHPEFTDTMKKIAKKYPNFSEIIKKSKRGILLTEQEQLLLKSYFKECADTMPGYKKTIGETYHKILVDWGIIEEQ